MPMRLQSLDLVDRLQLTATIHPSRLCVDKGEAKGIDLEYDELLPMIVRYRWRGEDGAIPMSNVKRMVFAKEIDIAHAPEANAFVGKLCKAPDLGMAADAITPQVAENVGAALAAVITNPTTSEAIEQARAMEQAKPNPVPDDIARAFARRKAGRPRKNG